MYRRRRSLWLALPLLQPAALAAGPAWTNASGTTTPPDPLSGSPASALTTTAPASAFAWAGTDSPLVSENAACESSKRAWYSSSSDWYWSSHASYAYESTTAYDTVWLGNYSGPLSTFCDRVPRAAGPAPTTTVATTVYVNSIPPAFPAPSPTCSFNYRGCELQVSSYRGWYATSHPATVDPPLPPLCEYGPDECIIPYGEDKCRLDAGEVKLIFWPSSKDPAQLCATASPAVTAAPTATAPVLAVSGNYTFTSPTVYLSFAELKGLPCYRTWENAIIPIPSQSLSTVAFAETQPIEKTMSLNWADMNSPVPLSAYKAQQSCLENWLGVRATASGADNCNTIYDDYLPWLALPTNPALFTGLDPLFGNCTNLFWRKYVFDPPYYLTPVGDLLPPTPTYRQTSYTAEAANLPSSVPAMTTISQPRGARGPIATVGTQTISADPHNPHNIVIGDETMAPGQVTAVGSTPIIVATGAVIVGSSTISLPAAGALQPVATLGSAVIVADGGNFVLPDGKTLSPGAVTVINRVTVSVASSGLVVGGSSTIAAPAQGAVLTLGSHTLTAKQQSSGVFVVGSQTITAGGAAATVSGVTISAASSGVVVVTDGTTATAPVSSLSASTSSAAGTGISASMTSVPAVGWATNSQPEATSSTRSGASSISTGVWVYFLGALDIVATLLIL